MFTDISASAGIAPHVGNGLGVAVGDYDDDGWPDVFVANDGVPNFLFHNEGNGRFTEVGLLAGVSVARDGKPRAGMGTEFADYNGDGRLDLVVTNHEFETHSLFRNDGGGTFTDATVESGVGPPTLPFVGFGVAFFDPDNDGAPDLAIVNGHVIDNTAVFRPGSTHAQRKLLLRNTNGRRFQEAGRESGRASPPTAWAGRWSPPTWTTTAASICWSPTTAARRSCCTTTPVARGTCRVVRGRHAQQSRRHRRPRQRDRRRPDRTCER